MADAVIRERNDGSMALAPKTAAAIRNRRGLLKVIGELGVSDSKRSFVRQQMGGKVWLQRYPSQSEPFINIAGAVQDLSTGPRILPRRFERRPAAMDKGFGGGLAGTICYRVDGTKSVSVGSPKDYATRVRKGGVSIQPITQTVRDNLTKVLKRARNAVKKAGGPEKILGSNLAQRMRAAGYLQKSVEQNRKDVKAIKTKPKGVFQKLVARLRGDKARRAMFVKAGSKVKKLVNNIAVQKLGFLFNEKGGGRRTVLRTKVAPRDYLGPSPEALLDMKSEIIAAIRKGA